MPKLSSFKALVATVTLLLGGPFCGLVHAQAQAVEVKDAWVRTSVQGQRATGAFMKITAREDMRLVGVATPVAGVAEIHEMKMEGDVMKMRAVPALDLPAGKTVELRSGGYHLMLQELRTALPRGSTVPVTLVFRNARGVESRMALQLPVSTTAPGGGTVTHGH
ncbi:MAG: copper chaperone PCu(A)C [Burkholderiaceae bacterium]|nr:copper chaperone PCu(A)C [Burkholderiaceae bacterium]MDO9089406.1 copper chaperone PCu(A)C [Burkholderiaceae bacterium]